jgi:hypothetical protein
MSAEWDPYSVEQKYPTRKDCERMAEVGITYGFWMLNMHDEIDSLREKTAMATTCMMRC